MRRAFRAFVVMVAVALFIVPAHARRVALVIGNGEYTRVGRLANPPRDAGAVEAMLKAAGFDSVRRVDNVGAAAMRRALRDFSDDVKDAEIAVVYYAGHGIEVNGANYLIPVDAALERDRDVEDETVPLDRVSAALEQASLLRLIILDACRDNPFLRAMSRTTRSIGRGLARVDAIAPSTLIAYAAQAGATAVDGTAANSPFTAALVKHLPTPGLDIRIALGRVRDEVLKSTANKQDSPLYGALGGTSIPLVPGAATGTSASAAVDAELARLKAEVERLRQQQAVNATSPVTTAASSQQPAVPSASTKPAIVGTPDGPDPARSVVPGSGQSFRDCPECPEMVVVPAGKFTMGSSPTEIADLTKEFSRYKQWWDSEGPQRTVTIRQPFAVGKFEVTLDEWAACVAGGVCTNNSGKGRQPVIARSWDNAMHYVAWLARKTGKPYRLLTEAEWEYAARAGTTTPFSTGSTITTAQANFNGTATYNGSTKGAYRGKSTEVGSFVANPFGLFDMHGNVYEWVEDCWHANYNRAPSDGSAWTTACMNSGRRVVRGGAFDFDPVSLRSASRRWYSSEDLNVISDWRNEIFSYLSMRIGFRVARILSQ